LRVWDIPPEKLCRQHLLGQHNEIHGLWTVITEGRRGYANHPETHRWTGKLPALWQRHETTVAEMARRGYNHQSPIDLSRLDGSPEQTDYVDTVEAQVTLLREKGCGCRLD
jgi:hypothetical protein